MEWYGEVTQRSALTLKSRSCAMSLISHFCVEQGGAPHLNLVKTGSVWRDVVSYEAALASVCLSLPVAFLLWS